MSPRSDPHLEKALRAHEESGIIPRDLILQIQGLQQVAATNWCIKFHRDSGEYRGQLIDESTLPINMLEGAISIPKVIRPPGRVIDEDYDFDWSAPWQPFNVLLTMRDWPEHIKDAIIGKGGA